MTIQATHEFTLKHPDGFEERWSVPRSVTRASLIACAIEMFEAAGISWGVAVEEMSPDLVAAIENLNAQRSKPDPDATFLNGSSSEEEKEKVAEPEYTENMALHDGDPPTDVPEDPAEPPPQEEQPQPGSRRGKKSDGDPDATA